MVKTNITLRLPLAMLALAASLVLTQLSASSAFAAVKTWDGGGSDNKFSTNSNWSDDIAPVAGDSIVFDTAAPSYSYDIDNDISAAFAGLSSTTPGTTSVAGYELLNPINLQANATWDVNDSLLIQSNGINVAGNFTILNGYVKAVTASGVVTVKDGAVLNVVPTATGVVVENGGNLACFAATNTTISIPLTLGGGSGIAPAMVSFGACQGAVGGTLPESQKLTIDSVTLQADAEVGVYNPHVIEVKSLTKNGHTLTREQYSTGQLITPDGTQENQEKTTQLDGDSATDVSITFKETAVLNGTRANVFVNNGGTLKGNGTVDSLTVAGILSPGNSPGKITVKQDLWLGASSIFEAEVLNKDSYDQVIVQAGGTVDITDSTLDLKFLAGGKVNQGETFTLIDFQDPAGTITGTFKGLAEGGRITIGSAVFSISYVGGSGNDVVLTALTTADAPLTPNTGFQLVMANPLLTAAFGILSVGLLLAASKRLARK